MGHALQARAQCLRHHLRRPIPGDRDLLISRQNIYNELLPDLAFRWRVFGVVGEEAWAPGDVGGHGVEPGQEQPEVKLLPYRGWARSVWTE